MDLQAAVAKAFPEVVEAERELYAKYAAELVRVIGPQLDTLVTRRTLLEVNIAFATYLRKSDFSSGMARVREEFDKYAPVYIDADITGAISSLRAALAEGDLPLNGSEVGLNREMCELLKQGALTFGKLLEDQIDLFFPFD